MSKRHWDLTAVMDVGGDALQRFSVLPIEKIKYHSLIKVFWLSLLSTLKITLSGRLP